MTAAPWLWIVFTLVAAGAQTVRNATQRSLTATLGATGATHVRFLFGLPFALVFIALAMAATGAAPPRPPAAYWPWVAAGALCQIAGTALMLMAMNARSFVVIYAYTKTEPVQVALFGLVLLGDALTSWMIVAILIATAGVVVISLKPLSPDSGEKKWDTRAALIGLASGAMFGIAAICFRGGILTLGADNYVMAATFNGVFALGIPTVLLSVWLAARNPATLAAILRQWRPSLLAGFLGAFASQFWFMAFALATAAAVRTVGLVEVLFAQMITHIVFRQRTTWREGIGVALIVAGVALLVAVHPA